MMYKGKNGWLYLYKKIGQDFLPMLGLVLAGSDQDNSLSLWGNSEKEMLFLALEWCFLRRNYPDKKAFGVLKESWQCVTGRQC
jgi:hypothetical protein